jgi:hypothetical protein
MSQKEKIRIAKQYIDKQLESMKNHGCAPKALTSTQYQSMVSQVAKTILK